MSAAGRRGLYPEVEPFSAGWLPTGGLHEIYYEECGAPNGKPVVVLHGGPGGAINTTMRRFFDPTRWRSVLFDQRGCGKSRPNASLQENTTWTLVEDIERLRKRLGIQKWSVFGGSWGSTLALAYAQAHPDRVMGCVLRGVFLGRPDEVDWFLHGLAAIFPDAHANFVSFLPAEERGEILDSYLKRLTDPDPSVHLPAARAWSIYEGSCSTLLPSPETVSSFAQDRTALGLARIEAYYFAHGLFLPPGGLLGAMGRIGHIPAEIVQGRYDMICPARTAFELAAAWPSARLSIVPDAGHSALEPGIRRALVAAVERFRHGR